MVAATAAAKAAAMTKAKRLEAEAA